MGGSQDEKKYTEQYKKNKLRTIDREKSPIVDIFDERIKLLNWLLCGLCEYNFIFEIDEVHGRRHVNAQCTQLVLGLHDRINLLLCFHQTLRCKPLD